MVAALASRDEIGNAPIWLERGYDERSHWMELLAVHPLLDPLRDEPRFAELLRRMKLPSDAWRR